MSQPMAAGSQRRAWLFPGHGSQYAGMGRQLLAQWPKARALFDLAEQLSGLPLRRISLNGDEARLQRPEVLEPALTALSLAHASLARAQAGPPHLLMGYSAGELAALCCAGVLSEEDALQIAVLRGRILQQAADALDGRMVTVSGLSSAHLQALVDTIGAPQALALAGLNAPDHHIVSGRADLVRLVEARALRLGAEVSPVQAAGPWHCPLVAGVADRIRPLLKGFRFSPPQLPLYLASRGGAASEPEQLREGLARQICEPIRWYSALTQLLPLADHFLEVGPGHILIGLVRRVIGTSRRYTLRAIERSGGRLSLAVPSGAARVMSAVPETYEERSQ